MAWKWSLLVVAATMVVVVACSSSSTSSGNGSGAISCAWCCSASPEVTCDCIVTTSSCPSTPPTTCGSACRGTCVIGRCDEGNQPPHSNVDGGHAAGDAGSSDAALACGADAADLCGGIDIETDVPCDVWAECAAQECTSAAGYPQAVACCRAGKLDNAVSSCQLTENDCEQTCVDQPGGPTTQCITACQTGFRTCIDKTCAGAGAAYH